MMRVLRKAWGHAHRPSVFVDTWGWLELAAGNDAVLDLRRQSQRSGVAWVTTDYILDEAITRLFKTSPFRLADAFFVEVFRGCDAGGLVVELITKERFESAYRLRLRYRDKPNISFTDFTSFVVMQELGLRRVLTADAHFLHVGMGFERVP